MPGNKQVGNPKNWAPNSMGISATIANVNLIMPNLPSAQAKDIPTNQLPRESIGQFENGVSSKSEATNRAGRRQIDRMKEPMMNVPAGRGAKAFGKRISYSGFCCLCR